jgi:hypothetical protein
MPQHDFGYQMSYLPRTYLKSPEEDSEAGELDKAQEVVGVVLPANKDPALP